MKEKTSVRVVVQQHQQQHQRNSNSHNNSSLKPSSFIALKSPNRASLFQYQNVLIEIYLYQLLMQII